MNVLKELISVHTIVTILLETIHVVAGLAIGYLPMVTPTLVSHLQKPLACSSQKQYASFPDNCLSNFVISNNFGISSTILEEIRNHYYIEGN